MSIIKAGSVISGQDVIIARVGKKVYIASETNPQITDSATAQKQDIPEAKHVSEQTK